MKTTNYLKPILKSFRMALLAEKLKSAGISTELKNYDGVTHEFFGMAAVVPQAKDAQAYAAARLKEALK